MNRNAIRIAAAAVAAGFAIVPVAQAQEESPAPNTAEKRAVEAAKKSPQDLRRFVNRTRMIYGLNFNDFYKEKE